MGRPTFAGCGIKVAAYLQTAVAHKICKSYKRSTMTFHTALNLTTRAGDRQVQNLQRAGATASVCGSHSDNLAEASGSNCTANLQLLPAILSTELGSLVAVFISPGIAVHFL
jgi:hypothetical protein